MFCRGDVYKDLSRHIQVETKGISLFSCIIIPGGPPCWLEFPEAVLRACQETSRIHLQSASGSRGVARFSQPPGGASSRTRESNYWAVLTRKCRCLELIRAPSQLDPRIILAWLTCVSLKDSKSQKTNATWVTSRE